MARFQLWLECGCIDYIDDPEPATFVPPTWARCTATEHETWDTPVMVIATQVVA